MPYLSISCESVSHKPLIIGRSCVKRHIERLIEELIVCNIVTHMENRVILIPGEPGKNPEIYERSN